jgi:hypothetical protein
MSNDCVFCDIDGTILKHLSGPNGDKTISEYLLLVQDEDYKSVNDVLPGVAVKFSKWNKNGTRIVLTTGRPESMRELTEWQLEAAGLFFDHLLMGVGTGRRYLINDKKPANEEHPEMLTAYAINLDRNKGFEDLDF